MKVLVFGKYGDISASSRLRFLQYFPYLQEHGVSVDWEPLLDNRYFDYVLRGDSVPLKYFISRYWYRFKLVFTARKYDVILLHLELFPCAPAFFEKLCYKIFKKPFVVVYDDATFHDYDISPNFIKRTVLKNKIAMVMRHAHTVVPGNAYVEHYAKKVGAKSVVKVPTVVDINAYVVPEKGSHMQANPLRIGWIGSPSTTKFLEIIKPVLQQLAKQAPIVFCTMGAKAFLLPEVNVENNEWSLATEISFCQSLDIGLMPLTNGFSERGKCGLKLIQYMACGKSVVGTPLEINKEIVQDGVHGFLADTEEAWLQALLKLCQSPELREKMGREGRRQVEQHYSLQSTAPQVLKILQHAASGYHSACLRKEG